MGIAAPRGAAHNDAPFTLEQGIVMHRMQSLAAVGLVGLLLPLVACDTGGGGASTAPLSDAGADAGSDAQADAGPEDTAAVADAAAEDTGPTEDVAPADDTASTDDAADTAEPDVPVEPAYPEGPYGLSKMDVIADIKFYSPSEKRWVYLHEYYNRPDVKLIIISSAAGWCGPCQQEAEEFGAYYEKHHPYGLEILYALFEDPNGNALIPDDPATNAFVEQWRDAFNVQYPLLIDPKNPNGSFALSPYYEEDAVPMAMTVRTSDMRIRYKAHGYSAAFIEYEILKDVYN